MTDYRQPLVALFQTTFKQWDGESKLSFPKPKDEKELATYKLRLKLSIEETFELFEAMLTPDAYEPFDKVLFDINNYIEQITLEHLDIDPVAIFDSLVDQDYVNIGFANILGLDMQAGFEEVQKSNMTKLDKDGNPIFREDGKLLKSELYVEPDLNTVFKNTSFKYNSLIKTRLTPEDIRGKIKEIQYHIVPNTTTTICSITLENGYVVNGESSCADPSAFSQEIGERFAYACAVEKIWPLEGYLLKEKLSKEL